MRSPAWLYSEMVACSSWQIQVLLFNPPHQVLKPPSQRHFPSTLGKSWLARKFPPVFSGSLGSILWFVAESLGETSFGWLPLFRTHRLKAHKLLCGLFQTSLLWVRHGHFPGFHGTSCLGEMLSQVWPQQEGWNLPGIWALLEDLEQSKS